MFEFFKLKDVDDWLFWNCYCYRFILKKWECLMILNILLYGNLLWMGKYFIDFFKNLNCNIYLIKYLVCCWFCGYFVVKLDLNVVVGNYI